MQPQFTPTNNSLSTCKQCDQTFTKRRWNQRYCSDRCKWTYNNHNRTLTPNTFYDCAICGKHVEKYTTPFQRKRDALLYCSRACKGVAQRGENHPMWAGGRTVNDQGYIYVHSPNHPSADRRGYVREHRLVMEQIIGRRLSPQEVVHHINDDPSDNRPENLMLFASQADHKAYESKYRKRDSRGRMLPLEANNE